MPNHVINRIRISDLGGAEPADVRGTFLNDDLQVDFGVIVNMPECLRDFSPHSGIVNRAMMALGILKEPSRNAQDIQSMTANLSFSNCMRDATKPIELSDIDGVLRAISNFKDCGYIYWYDWSNDCWGTKWNAYGQPDDGFDAGVMEFEFQTAWSHPDRLIKTMSQKNPSVRFEIEYADEDLGSNCGFYAIVNGEKSAEDIAPRYNDMGSDERAKFTRFAFNMHYPDEDPKAHGYGDDWVYSEEVEEAYAAE